LPGDLEWAADGSLLVADRGNQVVRRISPNRVVTTATGNLEPQDRPAGPIALALDPATRSPLMLDLLQGRVYRLAPELNFIEVIAGSGPGDGIGDGGPATSAPVGIGHRPRWRHLLRRFAELPDSQMDSTPVRRTRLERSL